MWTKIKTFFADSETIFWARLQMFAGILIEVASTIDPTLLAPVFGDYFPYFLIANGLLTEYLRRRREVDM
ncbi:hypothetical protein G6N73_10495 [Mesorhizobium camelthorni]|uniref:Uncharacterized protein n=2 Tax=Allomesorhizobium camelthorni TaxID=475069 RepID=A0A6G4WA08_9HYPH|nr:hypothetical protein [Mesorhizobium camelthorni]